jgi:hypothetical protein
MTSLNTEAVCGATHHDQNAFGSTRPTNKQIFEADTHPDELAALVHLRQCVSGLHCAHCCTTIATHHSITPRCSGNAGAGLPKLVFPRAKAGMFESAGRMHAITHMPRVRMCLVAILPYLLCVDLSWDLPMFSVLPDPKIFCAVGRFLEHSSVNTSKIPFKRCNSSSRRFRQTQQGHGRVGVPVAATEGSCVAVPRLVAEAARRWVQRYASESVQGMGPWMPRKVRLPFSYISLLSCASARTEVVCL